MGQCFSRPPLSPFHRKSDVQVPQGSKLQDPNVFATIPREIFDQILEQIPTDTGEGRQTLTACALVATWWTESSQRRLFSSVDVDQDSYEQWMNGVALSRSKALLLGYVHSLGYYQDIGDQMRGIPEEFGKCLPALRNLHSLTLSNIEVEHLSRENLRARFSAFRVTLTYLSLDNFTTLFRALVNLVDYFPNITTLQLRSFILKLDGGLVPHLSRPYQGKLLVSITRHGDLEFFNRFAKLDLEYEELTVESPYPMFIGVKFVESALRISAGTVKFLRLTSELQDGAAVTVRDFRQLQRLELVVGWPTFPHQTLSSVTSVELRKVIFLARYMRNWMDFARQVEQWALIDKELCGLVDALRATGYRHTLEVELRITRVGGDIGMYDFTELLAEFREKGVVTVMDAFRGNRVLHCSA